MTKRTDHSDRPVRAYEIQKIIPACAAILLTGILPADTLLWYRFDEQAPGTTATYGGTVVNSAGTSFQGAIACRKNATTFEETAGVLPVYENAFPDGVLLYDPISKTLRDNSRALRFKTSINHNLPCSAVRILDGDQMTPENFTIEMFIKSYNLSACNQWLIRSAAWNLWANGSGWVAANGRFQDSGQNTTVNGNALTDKAWHHIAIVRDNGTVTFYYDYKQSHQITGQGAVDYSTVTDVVIGSSLGLTYGGWDGLIDEVRISNTPLAPGQFLRLVHEDEHFDPDVYFHYSGESYDFEAFGELAPLATKLHAYTAYDALSSGGTLPNDAITYQTRGRLFWDGTYGAKPVVLTENLPGNLIRHGLTNTAARTESYALKFAANKQKNTDYDALSAFLWVDDPSDATLGAGSFTSECFIKYLSAPQKKIQYIMWQYGGTNGVQKNSWTLCHSSSRFQAMIWCPDENGNTKDYVLPEASKCVSLADDAWHHVAFVYDKEKRCVSVYLDYKLYGQQTDVELFSEPAPSTDSRQIEFGTGYKGAMHQINGCFDEIRITRRALDPQEFLTTLPTATGDTLFLAAFDQDLTAQPYPGVSPTGSVVQGTAALTGRQRPFTYFNGNATVEKNTGSALVLDGAEIDFGRNLMLESERTVTVEFLADIVSAPADARLVTFADAAGTPVWSVSAGAVPQNGPHAVALTVDAAAGTQTLYLDGTPVSTSPVTNPTAFTGSSFTLGDADIVGTLDEVRVSRGILETDTLFRLVKKETVLIVR